MKASSTISDTELLDRMPSLVLRERSCVADVLEHLVEIDRRRLYLEQACGSLSSYCMERLGYSEDEAVKRVRVARLAGRLPQVLDELREGAMHLTGLFMLGQYLDEQNYESWLSQARGKSKRQIGELIAARAPKPDVPERMAPEMDQLSISVGGTCSGTSLPVPATKLEPLSARRWSVQFTASAELRAKIEQAKELMSHAIPRGDLATLVERALDELIEREVKRKLGAGPSGRTHKARTLKPGSRHVPVEIARTVWERDGGQCSFVDSEGRRCSARRFLTLEHIQPFALGGPATADNICLLCKSHNLHRGRQVFGDRPRAAKPKVHRASGEPQVRPNPEGAAVFTKLSAGLRKMGFNGAEVRRALSKLGPTAKHDSLECLLRAALEVLAPVAARRTSS